MQYSSLGVFKLKEKKALQADIDALQSKVFALGSKLNGVEQELLSLPSGKAVWQHFNIPSNIDVLWQRSQAVHEAVAYKKPGMGVLGSAAVGGIVAGPAGAIVGAIYAANKNKKKELYAKNRRMQRIRRFPCFIRH